MSKRTLAELLLLLTTFIWGSTFVIVKGALEDASPLPFMSLRFTLAGLLLLWVLARGRVDPRACVPSLVLGVFLFGGYVFQTWGLLYTSPSKSAFITGFSVILVPVILMLYGVRLRGASIAGAILGQSSQNEYRALDDYGRALGEAFQIADDLLDVEGDAAALGKQTGQDAALGKTTFVTQLGIDGAKQRVRDLLAKADTALSIFGAKGDVLRAAARFVAERKN